MTAIFLKTATGTGTVGEKPSWVERFCSRLFSFLHSNPSYDKLHLVAVWYIEFIDGEPWREVGFDLAGKPVVSGPDAINYGFWLDTNMTLDDFSGESIPKEEFESVWLLSKELRKGKA